MTGSRSPIAGSTSPTPSGTRSRRYARTRARCVIGIRRSARSSGRAQMRLRRASTGTTSRCARSSSTLSASSEKQPRERAGTWMAPARATVGRPVGGLAHPRRQIAPVARPALLVLLQARALVAGGCASGPSSLPEPGALQWEVARGSDLCRGFASAHSVRLPWRGVPHVISCHLQGAMRPTRE